MSNKHIIDRHGNHMECHGKSIFVPPLSNKGLAAHEAIVDVYSYFAALGLTSGRSPYVMMATSIRGAGASLSPSSRLESVMVCLSPDDADQLAANLQAAAKRAREVDTVLAQKRGDHTMKTTQCFPQPEHNKDPHSFATGEITPFHILRPEFNTSSVCWGVRPIDATDYLPRGSVSSSQAGSQSWGNSIVFRP